MVEKNIRVLGPYAFSGLLVLLFFGHLLTGDQTFYFRDIHRWFYPMKYFLAGAYRDGVLPFWNSHYFCGAPFASDIQSGVFYPLSAVFFLPSFPLAFNLYVVAHFLLGFFFCHRFLRRTGRSGWAAIFGATSFCYGGFMISAINTLNNLTTAVWMPALLWRCQVILDGQSTPRGHVLTVLCLAMAILGGEPQLFIMMSGTAVVYMAVMADAPAWRERLKAAGIVPVMAAAAVALTMVQLGPTYEDYRLSTRAGGILYEMATAHSLIPGALRHLVMPLRFPADFATRSETLGQFFPGGGEVPWLLTIYPGFLVVPLAAASFLRRTDRASVFWLIVAAASIVTALGAYTPVHRIVYSVLPFFRFPEKFMFLAGFALMVLAATGLDRFRGRFQDARLGTAAASLLAAVLAADLYSAHRHVNPTTEPDFYQAHHDDLAPLFADGNRFRIYIDPETTQPDAFHNRVVNYHARWQLIQMPHLGIITGLDHVDGKTGMELQYQYIIHRLLSRPWKEKIGLLRIANVKYIISHAPLAKTAGLEGRVEQLTPLLYRLTDSLPRACIIGRSRPVGTLTYQDMAAGAFDPREVVLTDAPASDAGRPGVFQAVDDIVYASPGEIRIHVDARLPGMLFLSESAYPGWRVSVDGRASPPMRLNMLFQGVALPAGRHTIVFTYRTPGFTVFAGISIAAALCLAAVAWRRQRPSNR